MVGTTGDSYLSGLGSGLSSGASSARTRTISRPLTPAPAPAPQYHGPSCGFLAPRADGSSANSTARSPDDLPPSPKPSPTTARIASIAVSARTLRRQQQEAQRLAADVATAITRLSLLDLFGAALTRAQRWAIRDALRSVYLPVLADVTDAVAPVTPS